MMVTIIDYIYIAFTAAVKVAIQHILPTFILTRFLFPVALDTSIGVGTEGKVGRLRYMVSAAARTYNGGLGAEPPAGSRGRAPGQGVRGRSPPEAESFFAF